MQEDVLWGSKGPLIVLGGGRSKSGHQRCPGGLRLDYFRQTSSALRREGWMLKAPKPDTKGVGTENFGEKAPKITESGKNHRK